MQYLAGKLRAVLAVGVSTGRPWTSPPKRSQKHVGTQHHALSQGSMLACQFGLKQHGGAHNLLRNLHSAGILLAHLKVCLAARTSSLFLSLYTIFRVTAKISQPQVQPHTSALEPVPKERCTPHAATHCLCVLMHSNLTTQRARGVRFAAGSGPPLAPRLRLGRSAHGLWTTGRATSAPRVAAAALDASLRYSDLQNVNEPQKPPSPLGEPPEVSMAPEVAGGIECLCWCLSLMHVSLRGPMAPGVAGGTECLCSCAGVSAYCMSHCVGP